MFWESVSEKKYEERYQVDLTLNRSLFTYKCQRATDSVDGETVYLTECRWFNDHDALRRAVGIMWTLGNGPWVTLKNSLRVQRPLLQESRIIVSKAISGIPLRTLLENTDIAMSTGEFWLIAFRTAEAVMILHQRGYSHNDLDADSILMANKAGTGGSAALEDLFPIIRHFNQAAPITDKAGRILAEVLRINEERDDDEGKVPIYTVSPAHDIYCVRALFSELADSRSPLVDCEEWNKAVTMLELVDLARTMAAEYYPALLTEKA
jgi:hypothetical protein